MNALDRINIVQKINSGGTANVFLAIDMDTGFPVAVKELLPGHFKNLFVKQKFKEEANHYLYLNHPNIVKLNNYIEKENSVYLLMEYIEGKNLFDYMSKVTGPMPIQNVALFVSEILDALIYVHNQGLAHLDIKPSNIMLSSKDQIKLIDFGISNAKNTTKNETITGTPSYMSPEQIEGLNVDFRSDIYSLGITMYELITGYLPFKDAKSRDELFALIKAGKIPRIKSVHHFDKILEEKVNFIIQKACQKKPELRFQSCEEFQKFIKELL